ncbi:DNA recombination protein RmuC [Candidatus Pelagibacter sp.]|jgi:DNA recombination protein RmuC|nr:DNA recombination protein RmuC [Candidatus Pelagibacter sp.]
MDLIDLGFGIIIGIIIGAGGVFLFQQINKDKADDKAGSDVFREIESLKSEVEKYNTNVNTDRGSLNQILTDMRAAELQVGEAAREIKNTLVTGGGQKQGAWGQLILEHILENKLQFTKGQEFEVQKSFNTEDGRLIPDVLVHFPDGRDVVIDSKVSLTAWDRYVNSTDEAEKKEALSDHRISIKNHIDSLAGKKYQNIKDINSLDTVIMFCPNEPSISSLGDVSRKMMDYAISKKITLVGPSMLYFALKTVEYFWKTEKQSKNVQNIIDLANKVSAQSVEIYDSAQSAHDSVEKSMEKLEAVMSKIKDGRGSLLSRILKMIKIGGLSPKKEIPNNIKEEVTQDDDDEDKNE